MSNDQMQTTKQLLEIIEQRAAVGLKKYGVSLDRDDLKGSDWLRHLLEELCDAAGYVLAAERVQKETETAINAALSFLQDSYIANNKHRMGVLGAQDIDNAIRCLKAAVPGDE